MTDNKQLISASVDLQLIKDVNSYYENTNYHLSEQWWNLEKFMKDETGMVDSLNKYDYVLIERKDLVNILKLLEAIGFVSDDQRRQYTVVK